MMSCLQSRLNLQLTQPPEIGCASTPVLTAAVAVQREVASHLNGHLAAGGPLASPDVNADRRADAVRVRACFRAAALFMASIL